MSEPRPMKFWEAVSAFREFEPVLKEVFYSEKWRENYGRSFSRFDELVHTQDRSILDSYLPLDLTREIASRCTRLRFCLSKDGWLREVPADVAVESGAIALSVSEVHDRFGGSIIEEVREHGSARATECEAARGLSGSRGL